MGTIYHIAQINGDGIGQEVIPEAVRVVHRAAEIFGFRVEFTEFPWSTPYALEHFDVKNRVMLPPDAVQTVGQFDSALFGAAGMPTLAPDTQTLGLRLNLCEGLDLYAGLRPTDSIPGVTGILKGDPETHIFVVRETTEGQYNPRGTRGFEGDVEVATQTSRYTDTGCLRVMRFAFKLAEQRRGHVSTAHKRNANPYSGGLWKDMFDHVAAEFPNVQADDMLYDFFQPNVLKKPGNYDVIVLDNGYGDLLTDLLPMCIQGTMGLAPSANYNPERNFGLYEPVHGSAPDKAGQWIANPIASILSAAMMLRNLGQPSAADMIEEAVKRVTGRRVVITQDLGGKATTKEVTNAILQEMVV